MSVPGCQGFGVPAGVNAYDLAVAAIGAGNASTLEAVGADDGDFACIAGSSDPQSTFQTVLGYYTGTLGPTAIPASNVPTSSDTDILLGALGSPINTVADAATNAANNLSNWWANVQAWFSSYWYWIAAGVLAIILLIVFVYGAGRGALA